MCVRWRLASSSPCLTPLFPRALAVMGFLALAGVQMAVESVGVMILPAASSRGTSPTAGAPWAIRRFCGFPQEPPGSRSPSSGPAPTTLVSSPSSMGSSSQGSAPFLVSWFCPPHLHAAQQTSPKEGRWKRGSVGTWGSEPLRTVTHLPALISHLQHFEALGVGPSSMETGLWIHPGPTRLGGLSSGTTALLERRALGRVCQLRAPRPSRWMSM